MTRPSGSWDPPWLPTDPPTLVGLLTPQLRPLPLISGLAVVAGALYLAGAVRLWRSGRGWSVAATLMFLLGCALIALVMGLGVEGYGFRLFSAFMFQQLTLMMAAPPLLVLGRPGTLLLRAVPHRGAGRVVLRGALWGLRSWPGRVALHPALLIPLFLASFYGLYLSPLADTLLRSWASHVGLELFFLVAGILFTVPLLSTDPLPRRQRPWGRAVDMLVEMPLHAFFGVIVMMSSATLVRTFARPPASWGVDVLADQRVAGALAWSYGELPSVAMLLIIFLRWEREERRTEAATSSLQPTSDMALVAYNEYLDRLRRHGE